MHKEREMSIMKCGFFELDITPSLGCIIPGAFKARYATGILDRLYAHAFVCVDGEEALSVVSIDAVGVTLDITERIRARVAERAPIKPSNIMVVATHCHGGGPILNWGEEVVLDPVYVDIVVNKAADAIVVAYQNAEESELIKGKEELHGYSFVRVYRLKDGSLMTNAGKVADQIDCPTTTIDPDVLVLAVKQGDRFVGGVVNYANHPAIVARTEISGDYISELCRAMKEFYGPEFVTVFINGACGNINHINPFDPNSKARGRERVVGRALAEKVKQAIENGSRMENAKIATGEKNITVRFRKPDAAALLEAKEVFDSLGDGLVESVPGTLGYKATFFALQAFRIMADKRTVRDLSLQVFKIGDVCIAGTPCQIFVQFGKQIKKELGAYCFVSAFANDYAGYVAMPECFGEKAVYEATLCPTSALEPAAGDKVVQGIIELYRTLD